MDDTEYNKLEKKKALLSKFYPHFKSLGQYYQLGTWIKI